MIYLAKKIVKRIKTFTNRHTQTVSQNFISYPLSPALLMGSNIKTISAAQNIKCRIPYVYNITDSQFVSFRFAQRNIYKFQNATVFSGSDFVISENNCFWEKLYHPNINKNLPKDIHLKEFDRSNVIINYPVNSITVDNAISLMGVHSNHWAHFLCEQFEKLNQLKYLESYGTIQILVQKGIDPHIKFLIEQKISKTNFKILEVDFDTAVHCGNFFHIDRGSILTDHANYTSINDIIISPQVSNYIKTLSQNYEGSHNLKIFIGRKNTRSLANYGEIRDYFVNNGFVEVFPHELSIEEKIKLFSNATHVAGPGSSGFANAVFCKENTKILFFINYARAFDMLMTGLLRNYSVKYWHITGIDEDKSSINSSYYLPLSKLQSFFAETGFLE